MAKRIIFICLFLFSITGIKAQTTLCYHCYKQYDKNDIPQSKDFYQYFTVKDDFVYRSQKDGSYTTWPDGKPFKELFRYTGKKVDGAMLYLFWGSYPTIPPKEEFLNHKYLLISEDWSEINYVWTGEWCGHKSDPFTLCYKRCPFDDCDGTNVPGMKH